MPAQGSSPQDPNFAILRFENIKFLQPHQHEEMRRVGAAPKEPALEEDDNLTMMRPLDEGPAFFPRTMGQTGVLRRPGAPPPQRVYLVEGKEGRDATEGSESNFSQEN